MPTFERKGRSYQSPLASIETARQNALSIDFSDEPPVVPKQTGTWTLSIDIETWYHILIGHHSSNVGTAGYIQTFLVIVLSVRRLVNSIMMHNKCYDYRCRKVSLQGRLVMYLQTEMVMMSFGSMMSHAQTSGAFSDVETAKQKRHTRIFR